MGYGGPDGIRWDTGGPDGIWGSLWDTGGPDGIQGVPMGDGGSYWELGGPNGMWGVQVYMIDWMEEMQVLGGGPTSGYGGS